MNRLSKVFIAFPGIALALSLIFCSAVASTPPLWTHLSSASGDLPVPNGGSEQTATLVLDIDRDGVDDFVIGERTTAPSVVWYRRGTLGWTKYIIDASNLFIEAGGAFHDIDDDGDLDIVFGGDSRSNQIWWWENPYPDYAVNTPWTRRVIKNSGYTFHHDEMFGDFDGDGKDELVFWNQSARALMMAEIPLNPRTAEQWTYTTIFSHPTDPTTHEGLASADIDGDGKLDIVTAGLWLKHTGETNFTAEVIDPDQKFVRVAVGQLKAGGRPEVVFSAGDWAGPLTYHEWNGTSWTRRDLLGINIDHAHSLAIGDVNADGSLDIFCAEMRLNGSNPAAKMRVLYGDGLGHFSLQEISAGVGNHESRLGDLDGDGDLDILGKPYNWNTPRVDVWMNLGSGITGGSLDQWSYILADSSRSASVFGGGTFGLDAADLHGDGYQDIASGHYFYRNPGGTMTSTPWPRVTLPNNPQTGRPVDADLLFDLEGTGVKDDIIAEDLPTVMWLKANDAQGAAWTPTVIAQIPTTSHGNGRTVKLAHIIPTNTKPDILLSSGNGIHLMQIPENPGAGNWPITRIIASTNGEQKSFGIGDIDRDGNLDVAASIGAERLEVKWWRNPGDGSANWSTHVVGTTSGEAKMIEVRDVNLDGRLYIIVTEEARPANVYWFEAPPDPMSGNWTRHTVATGLDELDSMTGMDMNNDGRPDIVVGEIFGSRRVIIYENAGNGASWIAHVVDSLKESHNGTRLFDLDDDGDLDIVSIAYVDFQKMHVWKNNSSGAAPLPAVPVLQTPANGSAGIVPQQFLRWMRAANAASYRVQCARDTSFAVLNANLVVSDTLLALPDLESGVTFHWRVRSINTRGSSSWSEVWHFTTLAAPGQAIQIAPSNCSIDQSTSLQLIWHDAPFATDYRVQIARDSGFSSILTNVIVADTAYQCSGLDSGATYFWRIQSINPAAEALWSSVWNFTTLRIPGSPCLIAPANQVVNQPLSLVLVWTRSTSAISYRVQLSTDSLFSSLILNTGTSDSAREISGLSNSTRYFWRVNASNTHGVSPWSNRQCFTTIGSCPTAPSLVAPLNGMTAVSVFPTASWTAVTGATAYRLQVSTDSIFSAVVFDDSAITVLSTQIGQLQPGTTYFWRVSSRNSAGTSPHSDVWYFTNMLPAPALLEPVDGSTGIPTTTTLIWQPAQYAESYQLQVATDSAFQSVQFDSSGISSIVCQIVLLENSTVYHWRIRAANSQALSGWSPAWRFETIMRAPDCPILVWPEHNATVPPDTVQLVWRQSQPAVEEYRCVLANDSLFSVLLVDSLLTDTVMIVPLWSDQRTYWWRVSARNDSGWSPFSDAQLFVVTITSGKENEVIPKELNLFQNFPNPFNPTTVIRYALPQSSRVWLDVFDVLGRTVGLLIDGVQQAGEHDVQFDASHLASGVYLYRLRVGEQVLTRKCFLLR